MYAGFKIDLDEKNLQDLISKTTRKPITVAHKEDSKLREELFRIQRSSELDASEKKGKCRAILNDLVHGDPSKLSEQMGFYENLSYLSNLLEQTEKIDASELEKNNFPDSGFNVFLSHASGDSDLVKRFGQWLRDALGLKVFIDSEVWNYIGDILTAMDCVYCLQDESVHSEALFNYEKRNYSTAHAYMILSGALLKMIDNTECFIFIKTPNSLVDSVESLPLRKNIEEGKITNSPWIYSELLFSSVIRRKHSNRQIVLLEKADEDIRGAINYLASIEHLKELNIDDLETLYEKYRNSDILEKLYEMKNIRHKNSNTF